MFHGRQTLTSAETVYSTKWHNLKKRFRFLFNGEIKRHTQSSSPNSHRADAIHLIEDWYNCVAPERHKEPFRRLCKSILQFHQQTQNSHLSFDESSHDYFKAQNLLSLYGVLFAESVQTSVLGWLQQQLSRNKKDPGTATSPPHGRRRKSDENPCQDLIEVFRSVFSSIMQTVAGVSVTQSSFRSARKEATPLDRQNFRRKINWNDVDAKERLMGAVSGGAGTSRVARHNATQFGVVAAGVSMPGKSHMKGMKIPNNPYQHYIHNDDLIEAMQESDKSTQKIIVGSNVFTKSGSRFDNEAKERFQQNMKDKSNQKTVASLESPKSFCPGEHCITVKDLRGRRRHFTVSHQPQAANRNSRAAEKSDPDAVFDRVKNQAAAHAATSEFYASNNWKSTNQSLMCNHPAGGGTINLTTQREADPYSANSVDMMNKKKDVVSLKLNPKMETKEHPCYTAVTASVALCVPYGTQLKPLLD